MTRLGEIEKAFRESLSQAKSRQDVDTLRSRFLGRKGAMADIIRDTDFDSLEPEARRDAGHRLNNLKRYIREALDRALDSFSDTNKPPRIDLTLPATDRKKGSLHPVSLVQMELEDIFQRMGFQVLTGYEVESEYYNFDALNTPADHPARDMQDTFWLTNGQVLRTQTSANQVRTLRKHPPPVRAVFPGRCFRREKVDASHEDTFYQLEGLLVDKQVSVANLIAVMEYFLTAVFHRTVPVRLRPGFFPFVEPGFELDVRCVLCGGEGCPSCKKSGWVELVPCGLVHPRVLEHGGLDPDEYSGFAFGLGLTRLAMMKYHIPQVRLFNSADLRFGSQFPPFVPPTPVNREPEYTDQGRYQ